MLEPWDVTKLFETTFPGPLRTQAYRHSFFEDLLENLEGPQPQLVDLEVIWTVVGAGLTRVGVYIGGNSKQSRPMSGAAPRMVGYTFKPLTWNDIV